MSRQFSATFGTLLARIDRIGLRGGLLGGVSALCLLGGGTAGAAPASTTTADKGDSGATLSEVVVTAQKRAENLQDVPIAITALTASDLRSAGVQDLRDVTFQTPGLTYNDSGANTFAKPIIRGQTDIGGGENNVPVFFDGIYISNSSAIDFGLVDLARIEVIKGPVSALYGRSAYAGAINYVSAKPSDDYRGFLEFTGGEYGRYNVRGSLSGPIFGDVLKGGISGSYDHFDGTYHDSVTNADAGGYVKKDVLVNFDYTPNSHIEIRPVVYYGQDRFADSPVIFAPANCSVGLGYGYSQSYCGKVPDSTFVGPFISPTGSYGQTGNKREVFSANIQAIATYDWGTLSSLTGYNNISTKSYTEFDDQEYGTPTATYYLPPGATVGGFPAEGVTLGGLPTGQTVLTPLHFGYTDKNHDFSEELRYTTPQLGPVKFSVGGYYAYSYHYDNLSLSRGTDSVPAGQYIIDPFAVPPGAPTSGQHSSYILEDKIYAGFATADWNIIDRLSLSSQLRYTETDEKYQDLTAIFDPNPYGCLGYSTACGSTANPLGVSGPLTKSFYSLTSRNSLNFKFNPDTLLYVSVANGDKSGGFNNNTTYPTFSPERNWTYELGVKATFLDHRLQIDADGFYIDASRYQIYGPPPGATLPGGFITTNYGGLSTTGFEIAGKFIVAQGVTLSAGYAYANPQFKHDAYDFGDVTLCSGIASCAPRITTQGPNQAVSLQGLRPPYESNNTFNGAIDIRHEFSNGFIAVGRVDYRYESSQYYQYPIDTGSFGPKNIVNLRAGLEKGPYSLSVYVRNLTNDKTPVTVQDAAVTGASNFQAGYFPIAVLPDQRTVGVTLRYTLGG